MISMPNVTVIIEDLPSYPELCYWRDRKYGTGRVSRFWCEDIRPWLFPRQDRKVDLAWRLVKIRHAGEFELTMKGLLPEGET